MGEKRSWDNSWYAQIYVGQDAGGYKHNHGYTDAVWWNHLYFFARGKDQWASYAVVYYSKDSDGNDTRHEFGRVMYYESPDVWHIHMKVDDHNTDYNKYGLEIYNVKNLTHDNTAQGHTAGYSVGKGNIEVRKLYVCAENQNKQAGLKYQVTLPGGLNEGEFNTKLSNGDAATLGADKNRGPWTITFKKNQTIACTSTPLGSFSSAYELDDNNQPINRTFTFGITNTDDGLTASATVTTKESVDGSAPSLVIAGNPGTWSINEMPLMTNNNFLNCPSGFCPDGNSETDKAVYLIWQEELLRR